MKIRWNALFNSLLLLGFLFIITGLQTVFWYELFGNVPAPLLWLNMVVYLALYRKPFPAIISIYVVGFVLLSFTAMPLKMMWITMLLLFALVNGIKSRIFWSGSGYYSIMCAFSIVAYHVIYVLTSLLIEKNSVSLELTERLVQVILTPSFAFIMYWILAKIDKMTQDQLMHEVGGVEL